MVSSPHAESRSINSILTGVGITVFSFCKPSRAPTSTMRTWLGNMRGPVQAIDAVQCEMMPGHADCKRVRHGAVSFVPELDQRGIGFHKIARGGTNIFDDARARCLERQFH